MERETVGTKQKALAINLDARKYGAFAEIGAGQEVVRWFFHVGGAAGTIAKSISAYDMTVSDAIYGPSPRYVSRPRLETMLDYEFRLLTERLGKDVQLVGDETRRPTAVVRASGCGDLVEHAPAVARLRGEAYPSPFAPEPAA